MGQVIVRNLDDEVVVALKRKARLHGRPLEQELREILTTAARLSRHDKAALASKITSMTPRELKTDSADLIRADRDSR